MKPYILVVDDEPDICASVKDILEDDGYNVGIAENGETARRMVREKEPDLILLDIWMPDIDGISLLKEFSADQAMHAPVIIMSGHGTIETAIEATRLGAKDFIEKPLSLARLLHTVQEVLNAREQPEPTDSRHQIVSAVAPVGKSMPVQLLREHLERLAHNNSTVLISGEPGCGKTFSARFIHARSEYRNGPFVDVHTRQIKDGQGSVLLFGREDESGVVQGFMEQAQGGTLFLDDVAELDENMQKSLFAALSTGQWVRINGVSALPINLHIIVATRYNLEQEVRAGRFRQDLFHLLNVVRVHVPPLRDHLEDVTDLLQHYVNLLVEKEKLPYRNFTVAAQNRLRHYEWPGNIRELEGLVRRLLILGLDHDIELDEVEAALSTFSPFSSGAMIAEFELPIRQAREQFEKAYLEFHLRQAGGNVTKVARTVGMERTHLYRKLRALGIENKNTHRD